MSDQEKMREQCLSEFKKELAHNHEMILSEAEENCYRDGWKDCAAHYERQLAAAQNHIEALKRIIDEENKDHIEQQAALQADNVRLRKALERVQPYFVGEHYPDHPDCKAINEALAQPLDTSALDSLLAEARKVQGWQPIETAPMDGTTILLRNKKVAADGYWNHATKLSSAHWVWPYIHQEPTHWMPQPEETTRKVWDGKCPGECRECEAPDLCSKSRFCWRSDAEFDDSTEETEGKKI